MSQNQFSIPLEALANKVKANLELVVRKVTLDVFADVVRRSPVDTGRFRANWNVSYGAPDYSVTTDTSKTRASAEVNKALTLPVGGVTYLGNGLPYASRLEYGWSQQAPQGMIRLAVQAANDHIRAITK